MKRGQSIVEYVVLFLVVSAAFAAMYELASRAVSGRMALFANMVDTSPNNTGNVTVNSP